MSLEGAFVITPIVGRKTKSDNEDENKVKMTSPDSIKSIKKLSARTNQSYEGTTNLRNWLNNDS